MTEGQALRILLVEDDPVDREAIRRFVRQQGLAYDIDVAADSGAARECLEQKEYDIALVDYALDGGTGFDVFSTLGDTPSIIITGRGGEDVAGEALRRGAYDYLVKDGERVYLENLPGTINNVVARKKAERALRESEARYQDLFDNAPDMYFELDERRNVLSVNKQGASQLGYQVRELVGQPVTKVIQPEDVPKVDAQIREALNRPDQVYRNTFRKVRKDGSIVHVSESLSVHRGPGEPAVIRIICRDVTAQKEAEERARQLQERLARSERMESLGLLAGGVAHDLNNILGPMVAYPDLLLDKVPADSDAANLVLEVKRSATRAAAVIRDLLTLARRGRYPLEPLDLREVVQMYFESAGFQEIKRAYPAVDVEQRVASDLSLIRGSDTNLVKVLMNLVFNAFEAMPHGGRLLVELARRRIAATHLGYETVPPGEYVVLRVEDSGSGISREDQERMFEPFFTKKKMGRSGSGLGLSVVYGVVKDHGAYIDVQSDVGSGTALELYFPVADAEAPGAKAKEPRAYGGHERILVVDDAPEQRDLAKLVLTSMGYEVETACDGQEAIARIRERTAGGGAAYDLILLDMIMEEGFDGLDTYRAIQEVSPGQKCIIVSGYSETERVKEAQALGAGSYLAKPYTREALGECVRAVLDE